MDISRPDTDPPLWLENGPDDHHGYRHHLVPQSEEVSLCGWSPLVSAQTSGLTAALTRVISAQFLLQRVCIDHTLRGKFYWGRPDRLPRGIAGLGLLQGVATPVLPCPCLVNLAVMSLEAKQNKADQSDCR